MVPVPRVIGCLMACCLPAAGALAQPDLRVVTVTAPSSDCRPASLDGQRAFVTVENHGDSAAAERVELLVFDDLDRDGAPGPDPSELLGSSAVDLDLGPGASVELPVVLSGERRFRDSPLHALIDATGLIAETDELDNLGRSGLDCEPLVDLRDSELVLEWEWTWAPVITTPVVGDLDADGEPDVVAISSESWLLSGVYAFRGRDGSRHWRTDPNEVQLSSITAPLLAQLDDDPQLEVVVLDYDVTSLLAIDHDGSLLWQSDPLLSTIPFRAFGGGITLTDQDCDGRDEVAYLLDGFDSRTGARAWTPVAGGTAGENNGYLDSPHFAELDGEPGLELVAGPTAYRIDQSTGSMSIFWTRPDLPDGFTAVFDLLPDPGPEVLLVHAIDGDAVRVLSGTDGATLRTTALERAGGGCGDGGFLVARCGPPLVSDLDGDGLPEVVVSGPSWLTCVDDDGSVAWRLPIQDCSSGTATSAAFDFDGDGAAELVHRDERFLRIVDGASGSVLIETPSSSFTWQEGPVVADLDADGEPEILEPLSWTEGWRDWWGLRVQGERLGRWVSSRRSWTSYGHEPAGRADDASLLRDASGCPSDSWNRPPTLRRQLGGEAGPAQAAANLTLTGHSAERACSGWILVRCRVGNAGTRSVEAGTLVAARDPDAPAGDWLGRLELPALAPGESRDLSLVVPEPAGGEVEIVADASDLAFECREDDNACTLAVGGEASAVEPPAHIGPALRVRRENPFASDWTLRLDWSRDAGAPRPPGDHAHLRIGSHPSELREGLLAHPWASSWALLPHVDRGLARHCSFLRVAAANACEVLE